MNDKAQGPQSGEVAGKLRGRYIVTAALALVSVGLFFFRYLWSDGNHGDHLMRMGANYGPRVLAGDWYRPLASAFLHGDPIHLFANMIALWSFGPVLEALLGPRRYLVLYGGSALAGSLASAFLTDPRMSVGASGAVWGLMTAGIAVVYRPQGLLPESLLASARQRAWAPLAINLMYSFKPGVDFLAHIGGGVVGAGLVLSGVITAGLRPLGSAPFSRRDARGESPLWTALAAITGLAMIASVAAGFVLGKPWEGGKPPVLTSVTPGDMGVTLLLPDSVTSQMKSVASEGSTTFTYGDASEDPFLFDVLVGPLPAPIAPDAVQRELEGIKTALEEKLPEGATRVAPLHIETVGPHRVVEDQIKLESGVVAKRYALFTGARFVMLRSYELGERPKAWAGIEEKIVTSIAAK